MIKKSVFLKAQWRKLVMANYDIDPALLNGLIPNHTQLDLWQGKCLVSLVGFMFMDTRIKGVRVPGHIHFEEVNLRFYVKHTTPEGEVRRGTTFIKEIVKKPAITFVANTLYQEKYHTMPMRHSIEQGADLRVEYQWKYKGHWNSFSCKADTQIKPMLPGSEEEFITEHYWGYTKLNASTTSEYGVEHPRWDVYGVNDYHIDADFGNLYGQRFSVLSQLQPLSVLLAEGSDVLIRQGRKIRQ